MENEENADQRSKRNSCKAKRSSTHNRFLARHFQMVAGIMVIGGGAAVLWPGTSLVSVVFGSSL